uniref:Uncharacterized protein n=1 Tax=Thermocrinis ruber TaxID=75906 RepID=A0A7C5SXM7_9AQUI
MRKVVSIRKCLSYKGVCLKALHYVEDEFWAYDSLPDGAILVARIGARFLGLFLDRDRNLGWASFHPADIPDDWEGLYEYEHDLPVVSEFYPGAALLETPKTGRRFLVISEEAWENGWEEVKQYLLNHGWATPEPQLGEAVITLGGDPEFEVYVDGELVPANRLSIFSKGGLYGAVGTDGASSTAELRPSPAYSPKEYVENFLALVRRVSRRGILLSVKGDTYALGGHIHVGSSDQAVVKVLKDEVESFVRVLDDFVGRVLLPTSGRARGGYARLGAYELKRYGWEYRTPPSSFYADLKMVRIVYKLVKGLVEALLREGELIYETLGDGRARKEEYFRFLTKWETEYFLSFPQRWERGEVIPFVLTRGVPRVFFTFRDEWDDDKRRVFKDALRSLPVKRPVRLVLYGLAERRGEYFAIPTAPEDWVLREEFPKEPFIDGALPEVWVGIPYRFRRVEVIPPDLLKELVSWVEEYLAQLGLLAAPVAAE